MYLTYGRTSLLSIILLASLIQGCASVSTTRPAQAPSAEAQVAQQQHQKSIADIQSFALKGRIGVQTEGRGFSGSMDWRHDSAQDKIALYSPLGSQVASILKTAEAVTLEDANGHTVKARDAESLTQMTLGWKLPLTGLADWSLGRPTNSAIDNITWDESGRITRLVQDGWDIEYSDYVVFEGKSLPNKVYLRSPKVNIKLLVENRFGAS